MILVIHTDGGARGNPGPAASAFTARNSQNELLHEENRYLGETTNNVAEYTALCMAWDWLNLKNNLELTEVNFLLDSELIVKQMNGVYKIKDPKLSQLAVRIKSQQKLAKFAVKYLHIPRAENSEADALVNAAMDAELTHNSSTGK